VRRSIKVTVFVGSRWIMSGIDPGHWFSCGVLFAKSCGDGENVISVGDKNLGRLSENRTIFLACLSVARMFWLSDHRLQRPARRDV
jgi:hypothetical protein